MASAPPAEAVSGSPLPPRLGLNTIGTATRRTRLARLFPGGVIALVAGLLLMANYQWAQRAGYLPASWQAVSLPKWELAQRPPSATTPIPELQQATLAQHDFSNRSLAAEGMTPLGKETSPEVLAINAQPLATAPVAAPFTPETETVAAPVAVSKVAAPAVRVVARTVSKPVSKAALVPAKVTPIKAAATASGTTIKTRTGRYYVIAGAYGSLANAEKGRKVLARTGHVARVILPPYGSRLFRLTAADYPDLVSAQHEAQRLRLSTHCGYNTLKF